MRLSDPTKRAGIAGPGDRLADRLAAERRAERIQRGRWALVEALADALLERGEGDGGELAGLLGGPTTDDEARRANAARYRADF